MSIVQLGFLSVMSAPFCVALWVAARRRPWNPDLRDDAPDAIADRAPSRIGFDERETLDVEPMVRAAARSAQNLARAYFVHVELAVSPGIRTRVCPIALRNALRATVRTAISATRGGQVLITCATVGGQLQINVMDDGPDTNQKSREDLALAAEAMIAPHGGSISVVTKKGLSTTVTLCLPPLSGLIAEFNNPDHTHDWAEQAA
jgi:signal transduction histidine kinase